jgi:hypothetical protein
LVKRILNSRAETELQTKKAWDQFKGGFFVGACGSAGFAFICLSSIPAFTIQAYNIRQ